MVESTRLFASLRFASLRIASHCVRTWWKKYTHFGRVKYGKATRKSVSSATQNGFVKNTLSTAKDKP